MQYNAIQCREIPPYIPSKFKGKVLMICGSPLQVLIAERIIAMHPNTHFDAILVSATLQGRSPKYDYYRSRLKKICHRVHYIHREEHIGRLAKSIQIIRTAIIGSLLPKYDTIFLGPATNEIEPLLHKQKHAKIITLDEGTANLTTSTLQAVHWRQRGRLLKLLGRLIGSPDLYEMKAKAHMHISIFESANVSPIAKYVNLFPNCTTAKNQHEEILEVQRIMLGQPLYVLAPGNDLRQKEERSRQRIQEIVDKYAICHYFPHPRNKYHIKRVKYIESPLVFEDYIVQQLERFPQTRFEVYTFCSTSILTITQSKQLKFIAIKPSDAPENTQYIYDYAEHAGIEIISME